MANGTINRELAVLTKMLRLAYENRKLLRLPVIRTLKEAAPRQGFFEREQFLAVRARLPEDLQVAVSLAYAFGWRMQSEVLTLQRRPARCALSPERPRMTRGGSCIFRLTLNRPWWPKSAVSKLFSGSFGRIIPWLFPHSPRGARAEWRAWPRSGDRRAASRLP
jgi:hypothetical protein